jgi:flagellar biosynthesis protein FlhG
MSFLTFPQGRRATTIAVTSGKGGVGKTTLAVNLAIALARMNRQVGVLDADFALGNVDVMFGITPIAHLGAVLTGEKRLMDVAATTAAGVQVYPAGNGIRSLAALGPQQWRRLEDGIADVASGLDYLLIDTGPGIGDTVMHIARATDRVIVVTSNDPTAMVDAYAMVKLLLSAAPDRELGLVVNMVKSPAEGLLVARQLNAAVRRFLNGSIRYYGHVDQDARVHASVLEQRPLLAAGVDTPASRCYRRLAVRAGAWTLPDPMSMAAVPAQGMSAEEFARTEAPLCA